jgi:hypothetical protein
VPSTRFGQPPGMSLPTGPQTPGLAAAMAALTAAAQPAPGQERSSIEMAAGGNVLVEGESFTARSARLTWSEAKDLLVFEGDGRSVRSSNGR